MEHWDAFGKLNMVRLMLRLTWESFFPRLLIILLLVLGSLAFRLWLGQWDPPNRFTFSSFYMAVVLSSYFLGVAEAILTCLLSARASAPQRVPPPPVSMKRSDIWW